MLDVTQAVIVFRFEFRGCVPRENEPKIITLIWDGLCDPIDLQDIVRSVDGRFLFDRVPGDVHFLDVISGNGG